MKTSPSSPAPQTETCDLVVAGGGIGGVVTAITAARHGCRVVLIHDRSVLGGNASSEIKVLIAGANAMGYNKDARETGVLEELLVENSARSIDPGAALLDDVLWEWVTREPNIKLFLNTQVTRVTKDPSGRIAAVHALKAWSEDELTVEARFFADCTGDAVMANAAGAAWRMGREAKSEFGETMAQDVADSKVLGCTLGFQCRDQGKPVPFVPPAFARDFSDPESFPLRHHNRINFAPWWAEWGGELDPIHQYQEIKDELTRIIYGLWDHLKNHGDHGMENYALIRIATVLGKRESRRVEGPHMLTETDITSYRAFPDAVGYGGWPVDLHPPEGIYSKEAPADQIFVNPFEIPLRCLYSKNVGNLFTVGRDVSVSHVALGSTRVMGTIATMGQAVGTAVAVCLRDHIEPHQLKPAQIAEIQQTLLREDAYLIRQRNEDPCDAARFATAIATSDAPLFMETGSDWQPLEKGCAQLFPVTEGRIDSIRLFLKNTAEEPVKVGLKLHAASHLFDFSSAEVLAEATVSIPAGTAGWAEFPVNCAAPRGLYWVEVSQTPGVLWWRNTECEPAGTKTAERSADGSEWVAYRGYHVVDTATWITFRGCYTFRLTPDSRPHTPDQVINGVSRAVDWPNVWASDPASSLPQSLTLTFRQPVTLGTVLLTFDTDLDHRVPPRFSPLAVKDYRLWAESNGAEYLVAEVRDNYHRRRSHSAPGMRAQSLRLEILATNGAPSARVFEIRVYEKAVPGFACRPA